MTAWPRVHIAVARYMATLNSMKANEQAQDTEESKVGG